MLSPSERRIDRSGEARRAGADHRDVEHRCRIQYFGDAERVGELRLSRVAQQLDARSDHDRQVLGRQREGCSGGRPPPDPSSVSKSRNG